MGFLAARVKETTTTTGTGAMQLLGALTGYRSFVSAFGPGNRCFYFVVDGSAWEYGLGTIDASSALDRTQVYNSSNSGNVLTLAAGTKIVTCPSLPPECCVNNGSQLIINGTTPSVYDQRVLMFNYSSGATITDFVNAHDGHELFLLFQNTNTTIGHGSTIKLSGGANFAGTANDTMRLVLYSGVWYEVSRSVNT